MTQFLPVQSMKMCRRETQISRVGQDHDSQKLYWFFHNKNSIFYANIRVLQCLKSYTQSMVLLDVFIIRPLLVLRTTKENRGGTGSKNTIVLHRRHNQNHGSRRIQYFFLISRRIILENHDSLEKKTSYFTFHGKKLCHSRITKTPLTTLECRSFFRLMS